MKLELEIRQQGFKTQEQKLTVNLIYTYFWLLDRIKDRLRPHGVSMQQYNILRILRGQGSHPASINLLKERMLDKSSDASRLVERMRMKGLVVRVVCPGDRRAVEISISETGLALLKAIDDQEDGGYQGICNALGEPEIKKLNELLDGLRG